MGDAAAAFNGCRFGSASLSLATSLIFASRYISLISRLAFTRRCFGNTGTFSRANNFSRFLRRRDFALYNCHDAHHSMFRNFD